MNVKLPSVPFKALVSLVEALHRAPMGALCLVAMVALIGSFSLAGIVLWRH